MSAKILVVEDEEVWSKLIKDILLEGGYQVEVVDNVDDAIKRLKKAPPHIVISDVNLGGISGIQLCQWIRSDPAITHIPIMILTVLKTEGDKVKGLESGADDYLEKPFGRQEFMARVNALLRRSRTEKIHTMHIAVKNLSVDLESHEVKVKGKPIELRPKEFALLSTLIQRRGKVISKESLIELAWGEEQLIVTSQTLAQHIKNLRAKLGSSAQYIETVETLGYKFRDS